MVVEMPVIRKQRYMAKYIGGLDAVARSRSHTSSADVITVSSTISKFSIVPGVVRQLARVRDVIASGCQIWCPMSDGQSNVRLIGISAPLSPRCAAAASAAAARALTSTDLHCWNGLEGNPWRHVHGSMTQMTFQTRS